MIHQSVSTIFLCVLSFLQMATHSVTHDPLQSYLWENRLLIIACSEAELLEVTSTLKQASQGIAERDLLWFVLSGGTLISNQTEPVQMGMHDLLKQTFFSEQDDGFQLRLVGKDGGVKTRSQSLDLDQIFALVDSMPMRQAEMRAMSQKSR